MRYYLIEDDDINLIYDDMDLSHEANYTTELKAIKEDLEQCQELGTLFFVFDYDEEKPICGISLGEALEKHSDIKEFILKEINS